MTIRGEPTDYWVRSKFRVEFDGIVYAGFRDCSEIGGELDAVEHREGGANYPFQKAGNESYPEVTLTSGLSDMPNELYSWWNDCRQGGRDRSKRRSEYVKTGHVIQMDEDAGDVYQWTLFESWPRVYRVGGWDKGASEVTIKTLILRYAYFDEKSLVTT